MGGHHCRQSGKSSTRDTSPFGKLSARGTICSSSARVGTQAQFDDWQTNSMESIAYGESFLPFAQSKWCRWSASTVPIPFYATFTLATFVPRQPMSEGANLMGYDVPLSP
jgi:hypothetical protein